MAIFDNDDRRAKITNRNGIWTTKVRGIFVVLVISFLVIATPILSSAQPVDESNTAQTKQNHIDELIQKAGTGTIRVIVVLNVPFSAEGELDEEEIAAQRKTIQTAQQSVLSQLEVEDASREESVYVSSFTPIIAIAADKSILERLGASSLVLDVVEDVAIPPTLVESIPLIGTPDAWDAGFTGQGYTVAILDTGVHASHAMLSGKVVEEACYSTSTPSSTSLCPDGSDEQVGPGSAVPCSVAGCDHGTHVAGIAAGKQITVSGNTYSGVARDADVIAIQVFSKFNNPASCSGQPAPCPLSYTSDQMQGLDRVYSLALAGSYDIASVNLSLGGGRFTSECDSQPAKMAIDNLKSIKIATVIASGNNGYHDALGAPACISTAVSVGSTTDFDTSFLQANLVSSFTNRASFLDLMAPGEVITSSVPGGSSNTMTEMSGTSMAAPHVAGAWALMKQESPQASVDDILTALQNTGMQVDDQASALSFKRVRVVPEFPLPAAIIAAMVLIPVILALRKYTAGAPIK